MNNNSLIEGIFNKSISVGIIGMGYVGLPLALSFAGKGFSVTGFDVDSKKTDLLEAGQSYISHIPDDTIKQQIASGCLIPCKEFRKLAEMAVIIICVPTPLTDRREPDLSYVKSTARDIAPNLQAEQLVILESTTYPGCCTEVLKPLLEKSGLVSGEDFYLAYSPEREDPGNYKYVTSNIPKVVGADGPKALELALALYGQIVVQTVPVTSMEVAEAVKLTENIFRSVNIALVNELKTIYGKMGVNIWEVVAAAKTKPFGYMPFYPGPGLGGHCIPIDPFYLAWRAKEFGEEARFIELAGKINTSMPERVIDVLEQALIKRARKTLANSSILLLGLAYKKNVNDTRESPAFPLIQMMETRGAKVSYYDPYVPEIPPARGYTNLLGRKGVEWSKEVLASFDAALICTDHDNVDYSELLKASNLVIDTRNATSHINHGREKIIGA